MTALQKARTAMRTVVEALNESGEKLDLGNEARIALSNRAARCADQLWHLINELDREAGK